MQLFVGVVHGVSVSAVYSINDVFRDNLTLKTEALLSIELLDRSQNNN